MVEKGTYVNSIRQDTAIVLTTNSLLIWRGTIYGNRLPRGTQVKKGSEPRI